MNAAGALFVTLFLLLATATAEAQSTAPEVFINPGGGSYTAASTISVRVSIFFTDPDGLNAATREVRLWNGSSSVAVSLAWATGAGGTHGTLTGDIVLKTAGDNVLKAEIQDVLGNPGLGQATFKLGRPPASNGAPLLSLTPHHNEFRDTTQGAMVLSYAGPSYTSMDVVRAAGLVYNSEHAAPTAFFQVDARPELGTSGWVALSLRLESETANADGTYPLVGREYFYKVGTSPTQRLTAFLNLSGASNGARKYWAVVRAYRGDGTYTETRQKVRALILNGAQSRYGAGWSVAGVQRIHANSLGAAIDEGNGIARWFQRNSTTGLYETPDGDFSSLVKDASGTWVRTYPGGDKLTFSSTGRLETAEDRFGRTTTYVWQNTTDPAPVPVIAKIVDPVGKETTFAYSASGYLYSITAAGRTVYCTYDGKNLVKIEGAKTLSLTYHAGTSRVASYNVSYGAADDGVTHTVAYDAFNRVSAVTAPLVTANGVLVSPRTEYRSLESTLVLGEGIGASRQNPADAVDSASVEIKVFDPEGHETRIAVDRYGNPVKVIEGGMTTTVTYNAAGLPEIVIANNGMEARTHGWNAKGQLLQTILYTGATDTGAIVYAASYNSRNLLTQETSGGSTTWYTYGDRGQLLRSWYGKQSDSTRTGTTYEYNGRYQVTRITDPKGGKVESYFEGNEWRNADWTQVIRDDGVVAKTSFVYDVYGRTQRITNPLNEATTVTYDSQDRPLTVTDAKPRTTTYSYTGAFLTSVVDPKGKTYEFGYNDLGWLEWERYPDAKQRSYGYNRDGQLTFRRDRNNKDVWFSYDSAHRLHDRWADGVTATFRRPDQHTTVVTNNESTITTQTMPSIGELDKVSVTLAGRVFELKTIRTAANEWRDDGIDVNIYLNGTKLRTDSIRYSTNFNPAEPERGSTYSIQDPSGRTTVLAFDTAGRNTQTFFPNGVTQLNSFRNDARLYKSMYSVSAVSQKLGALFEYDLLGRLDSRTNTLADTMLTYSYDPAGRLTTYARFVPFESVPCDRSTRDDCPEPSWVHAASTTFKYDDADNRTDRSATLQSSSNRYATFDGFSLEYDLEGNLTKKYKAGVLDQSFTWNSLGQLASVTTNGTVVSYGYDAAGRRVRRTENGTSTYFLYDGDDLLMEIDATGNPYRTYTHLPGTDRPVSVRTGQDFVYYYTLEHPGHVRGLLNVNGAVAGEYRYTPYGEVELSTASVNQPLRFMARELDLKSGLYYVRNRWYDPLMGRFISEDPIGLEGGLNTYAYAGNDPMNHRDPSGLGPEPYVLPAVHVICKFGYDPNCDDGVPWYADGIFDAWARMREMDRYNPGDMYQGYDQTYQRALQQKSRDARDCWINALEVDVQAGAFASASAKIGVVGVSLTADGISTHGMLKDGHIRSTMTSGAYGDVTLLGFTIPIAWNKRETDMRTGKTTFQTGFGRPEFKFPLGGGLGRGVGLAATYNLGAAVQCYWGVARR